MGYDEDDAPAYAVFLLRKLFERYSPQRNGQTFIYGILMCWRCCAVGVCALCVLCGHLSLQWQSRKLAIQQTPAAAQRSSVATICSNHSQLTSFWYDFVVYMLNNNKQQTSNNKKTYLIYLAKKHKNSGRHYYMLLSNSNVRLAAKARWACVAQRFQNVWQDSSDKHLPS